MPGHTYLFYLVQLYGTFDKSIFHQTFVMYYYVLHDLCLNIDSLANWHELYG